MQMLKMRGSIVVNVFLEELTMVDMVLNILGISWIIPAIWVFFDAKKHRVEKPLGWAMKVFAWPFVIKTYIKVRNGEVVIEKSQKKKWMNITAILLILIIGGGWIHLNVLDTGLPRIYLTEGAREIVLDDFDFLTAQIIENAPAQMVIESRNNMTIEEFFEVERQWIIDNDSIQSFHFYLMGETYPTEIFPTDDEGIAEIFLSSLLFSITIEQESIGHLMPRGIVMFRNQLEMAAAMVHQFENNGGYIYMNGEYQDFSKAEFNRVNNWMNTFTQERTLEFYGLDVSKLDLEATIGGTVEQFEGNIELNIIEEGHIAYMRIQSFASNFEADSEIFIPFFKEIQDYNHLIIDLRGNLGGFVNYPLELISMLIESPLEAGYYEFFMDGALIKREFNNGIIYSLGGTPTEVKTVEEIILSGNFSNFDENLLERLSYGVQWKYIIEPSGQNNMPFEGEIWILVDSNSQSASELLALLAMDSGFATVIGQSTGGVTPVLMTYVSLPRTGIVYRIDLGTIIDGNGLQIEAYGVTPDIIVDETIDVLEFLLEKIQ